jgi:toxin ParE1/3/4
MHVRWTTDAADDLERIYDHVAETNSDAARRIATTIVDGIASLDAFPQRGRPGRVTGTREFVFTPLPWIAVYEVDVEVRVLRILHGPQQWPRSEPRSTARAALVRRRRGLD